MRGKSGDAGRESFRKRGEAAVMQLGLLIRVCKYTYTRILNLVLVNSLRLTVGGDAHLDPLRPRICTHVVGSRLSVVLLEQHGNRALFVHSIGVRPYIGNERLSNVVLKLIKQYMGLKYIPVISYATRPPMLSVVCWPCCLLAQVVNYLYPIEQWFTFPSMSWM